MQPDLINILVVDDDPAHRRWLTSELEQLGYRVSSTGRLATARALLERQDVGLVLAALALPDGSGMDVLAQAAALRPSVPVVLLAEGARVDDAVAAIKRGAVEFLERPVHPGRLALVVAGAIRARVTVDEEEGASGLVGESAPLRAITDKITHLAATDTTVLIQGESGTGKELVARALHERSARRRRAFVALDCGTLDANLLASELFGHVRGAFTGADGARQGLFRAAHLGTLFLDEVSNLGLDLQAHLLRVLQERRIRPLGSSDEHEVDVRVIAATNCDLRQAVEDGRFREDLYYRLAVVTLEVPTLRERKSDVPALARHFAATFGARLGRLPITITPSVIAQLQLYSWPGNVRELANVLERAVVMATGGLVRRIELPSVLAVALPGSTTTVEPLDDTVRRAEGEAIRRALRLSSSKVEAARRLGISRRTLYEKMEKHQVKPGEGSAVD